MRRARAARVALPEDGAGAGPASPGTPRPPRLQPAVEVALASVTIAALVALKPLFDDWSFLAPLVAIGVAVHVTLALSRRGGLGLLLSGAAVIVVTVVIGTWLFERASSWHGLPGGQAGRAARRHLVAAWDLFQHVSAPTHAATGFLIATAVAISVAVFIADWAAFRLSAPFEAILPTATIVLFAAVLGAEDHPLLPAALYLAAALGFVLLHRAHRQEQTKRWIGHGTGRGTRWMLAIGSGLALVALGVGLGTAPRLPGAGEPGLISLAGRGGAGGSRVTLSPLVDIRARLLDQRQAVVFRVRSPVASYWRLTSLDRFDGDIWSSGGSFEQARGWLPKGVTRDRRSRQVEQRFEIEALSAIWLPAAFEPSSLDAGDMAVRWEPASSTLIVDQDRATSDHTSYRVTSSIPEFTADELRTAPEPPPDLLHHYTALPDDFSPEIRDLARRVVAGAPTAYDQARALQDWFRDNFTYSTDVPAGQGLDAIDAFLQRRTGFCEHFAGTYAAMARSIGLPSRVAVGFTPGAQDEDHPDRFVVRGRNAHAWPEVYLARFGWVAFEPTPGRGAPGAEPYTGVAPQQQADPTTATTRPAQGAATSIVAPTTTVATQATAEAPVPAAEQGGSGSSWAQWAAVLFGVVLAAGVAYVVFVVFAFSLRRARWRVRAGRDANERTRVAWLAANEALATIGVVADPAETPLEFSSRLREGPSDVGGDAHRALAQAATAADYAPGGVSEAVGAQATRDARAVIARVKERTPWPRRALGRLTRGGRGGDAQSSRRKRSRMR